MFYDDAIDMLEMDDGSFGATLLDNLVNSVRSGVTETGREVAERGREVVADRGSAAVEEMMRSTAFAKVLDAVEAKAQAAVVKEVSKNAMALFGLAIAGGAVGGMVFKGKAGAGAAVGITIWSVWMLSGGSAPAPGKR